MSVHLQVLKYESLTERAFLKHKHHFIINPNKINDNSSIIIIPSQIQFSLIVSKMSLYR